MKKIAFMLISLYMGLMGANAQSNKFDLNEDGHVNITDVTKLVTNILDQNNINGYDLNDDEDVNITDVILMVNYILNQNDNLICPNSNHPHMIDLGLPSGTKWACCNVGAHSPEEYGGYYAWGETEEKDIYNDVTYLYATGVDEDLDGFYIDWGEIYRGKWQILGSDIAGTQYDVAHVKWGGNWCMPNNNEFQELLDNCTYEWTTLNDVKGVLFTSNINGGTIFLPATGYFQYTHLYNAGVLGEYRSSSQDPSHLDCAGILFFHLGNVYSPDYDFRSLGYTVRPVWKE